MVDGARIPAADSHVLATRQLCAALSAWCIPRQLALRCIKRVPAPAAQGLALTGYFVYFVRKCELALKALRISSRNFRWLARMQTHQLQQMNI